MMMIPLSYLDLPWLSLDGFLPRAPDMAKLHATYQEGCL
jgi:hypothetical protein